MTTLASHLSTFLREYLPRDRAASPLKARGAKIVAVIVCQSDGIASNFFQIIDGAGRRGNNLANSGERPWRETFHAERAFQIHEEHIAGPYLGVFVHVVALEDVFQVELSLRTSRC